MLLAMSPEASRFHRSVVAAPGPNRLRLPDDVLDAARPSLADVRLVANGSEEIAYALGDAVAATEARLIPRDVTTTAQRTTALLDRGDRAGWADALRIEVDSTEFVKPVVLEASSDRVGWARLASSTIFAVAGTSSTWVHFAPSDARYLRVLLDDRNGPRVRPTAVAVRMLTPVIPATTRTLELPLTPSADAELGFATYALTLPSRNLPLHSLRLLTQDAAFARQVRLYERWWFRGEASRRLLGEASIVRSGGGHEALEIPLPNATAQQLEVDIERTENGPLQVTAPPSSCATDRPRP